MGRPRSDTRAREMYSLYLQGLSLEKVADVYGVTRQSVWGLFERRGFPLRPRAAPLPTVEYNGELYAPDPDGYYRKTRGDRKWLHHAVWEDANGSIPTGMHIHHMDHDTANNALTNLRCISPGEHSKLHNPYLEVPPRCCLWCGTLLVRKRQPSGRLETPAEVARRLYCNTPCQSAHRTGKPKGWSPVRG